MQYICKCLIFPYNFKEINQIHGIYWVLSIKSIIMGEVRDFNGLCRNGEDKTVGKIFICLHRRKNLIWYIHLVIK